MSAAMISLHGGNRIAGRVVTTGAIFQAEDPATGAVLPGTFHEAGAAEVDGACRTAAAAHAAGLTVAQRRALLEAIAGGIEALGESLLERCQAETALPRARLLGERGRTCMQLRAFADLLGSGTAEAAIIDAALPERHPPPRPDLRSLLLPIGPVAVFGAANFPLAFSTAGGDTAAALAAGCPVVMKGHPAHPGTGELVAGVIAAALSGLGLHPGFFSFLHGRGNAVGEALVTHPAIAAGAFTGSLRGGRALLDLAQARPCPIPFHAEMGSANPVFVLPEALTDAAAVVGLADLLAGSIGLGGGQFCTRPGVIVVAGPQGKAMADALAARIRGLPAATLLHRGIAASYQAVLAGMRAQPAVRLLAEGLAGTGPCVGRATLWQVQAADLRAGPHLWDERFGPCSLLVVCANAAEQLGVAVAMPGSLTATMHGVPDAAAKDLLSVLSSRAGRVLWGGVPTGVEVCAAMMHGGPWPAASDSRMSSVGATAIARFQRRVCFQNLPDELLPSVLQRGNPAQAERLRDSRWSRDPG